MPIISVFFGIIIRMFYDDHKHMQGTRYRTQWLTQLYTAAELTRRGYLLSLTLGNAPVSGRICLSEAPTLANSQWYYFESLMSLVLKRIEQTDGRIIQQHFAYRLQPCRS